MRYLVLVISILGAVTSAASDLENVVRIDSGYVAGSGTSIRSYKRHSIRRASRGRTALARTATGETLDHHSFGEIFFAFLSAIAERRCKRQDERRLPNH